MLAEEGSRTWGRKGAGLLVGGPVGPVFDRVIEGELDRARQWGAELGSKAAKATGELLAV